MPAPFFDHLQRQAMLRGAALAVSLWSPRASLNWADFQKRLVVPRARLDAEKIPYWWEPETTPQLISNAELLVDGKVVSTDKHPYTGTVEPRRPNQYYRLTLPSYEKGSKYELRYQIKEIKGGCSGVVMLIPALAPDQYAEKRGAESTSNKSNQKQPDEL